MNGNSTVLDFVRRQAGREDFQPEGVFPADPEEQAEFGKADQEYDGGLRYVNIPPNVLRGMLESEVDPGEAEAIRTALMAWGKMSPKAGVGTGVIVAGETETEEPRKAVMARSIMDVARGTERVSWPSVIGGMGEGIPASYGEPSSGRSGGRFLGWDIIDYEALSEWQEAEPLPASEDEDWF
jgi:hypothetical protein